MAVNLTTVVSRALTTIFNLGSDIVKAVTFYRPATYNPQTGEVVSAEIRASCSVVMGESPSRQIGGFTLTVSPRGRALFKDSDLTTITGGPKKGDYFIDGDGLRRDVIEAPKEDNTGQFWQIEFERSIDEDWGDLTSFTSSEDFGDLTADTSAEDRGDLFFVST